MEICERLQKLRKLSNYSQEQLANMISVSRQAISKWESGKLYLSK
nr:helix-turn-helix transcriptional regulator [Clostridium sporogenes]